MRRKYDFSETAITNSEIEYAISQLIHNEQDRMILHDYFINGYTNDRLADKYNYSVEAIKKKIYKHGDKIWLSFLK